MTQKKKINGYIKENKKSILKTKLKFSVDVSVVQHIYLSYRKGMLTTVPFCLEHSQRLMEMPCV